MTEQRADAQAQADLTRGGLSEESTPHQPGISLSAGGSHAEQSSDQTTDGLTNRSVPGEALRKASGWFIIGADGVLRGWCLDRQHPSERQTLLIRADGGTVGQATANRLDPDLAAQAGYGDGRCAFAFALPDTLRDGITHRMTIEVATQGYQASNLKTKSDIFTAAPGSYLPQVELLSLADDEIAGQVDGVSAEPEIDCWLKGERLAPDNYRCTWSRRADDNHHFHLTLRGCPVERLVTEKFAIAYRGVDPNEQEIARAADLLQVTVEALDEHRYGIALGERIRLRHGTILRATISDTSDDALAFHDQQLVFTDNRATLTIQDEQAGGRYRLQLQTREGKPLGSAVQFEAKSATRRLVRNGNFDLWTKTGPSDFTSGEGVRFERGHYAFDDALKARTQVSGSTLVAELPATLDGTHVVLSQELRRSQAVGLSPIELGLGGLVRASQACVITIQLLAAGGAVETLYEGLIGTKWRNIWRSVQFARAREEAGSLSLKLICRRASEDTEPLYIELAGLHLGESTIDSFADETPTQKRLTDAGEDANLVVNASLSRWPRGLAITSHSSRGEITDGWAFFNRRSEAEVLAAADLGPPGKTGYALSFEAPQVPLYLRLEISLRCRDLPNRGFVSFFARGAAPAGGTIGSFYPQNWRFIDAIYILRREVIRSNDGIVSRDTTIAKIARKVIVTPEWQCNQFDFDTESASSGDHDIVNDADDSICEHLLVFEFRKATRISFFGVEVKAATAERAASEQSLLLEDRNILAQIGTIRGIDHWGSAAIIEPILYPAATTAKIEQRRWNWRNAAAGSVEVAICIYNAIDETLACLRSLVGSTTVPHTVRLINDGSDPQTREQLIAFIRDKPWMTLVDNGANLGYTRSANRAVLESEADWVILLNSDTIVSDGWIEGLLEAAQSDPETAFVGAVSNAATYQSIPELYNSAGKWAVNDLPLGLSAQAVARFVHDTSGRHFPEVPLLNGFCTLMRRAVFREVGGLNEAAFPAGYGEENDLCLRVRAAGYRLRVADHVYVYHTKSASFGSVRRAELAKAGDKALRALHPNVDFQALGRSFMETPALVELRSKMRAAFPAIQSAAAS